MIRATCTIAVVALLGATANAQWTATETQTLLPADAATGDWIGYDLAIDGTTAVVGAPGEDAMGSSAGAAYVFEYDGKIWTEGPKLTASDGATGDHFGRKVVVSGDTILVGAPFDDQLFPFQGSVYIRLRNGTSWNAAGRLNPSNPGTDYFGLRMALDGDTAVVGAPNKTTAAGNAAGVAYVFFRNGSWAEQAILEPSDGVALQGFPDALAIEGDTILAGSVNADHSGLFDAGAVYVFGRSGTVWTETQKVMASDPLDDSFYGNSVAIEAGRALVGAPWDEPGGLFKAGSVYFLTEAGGTWTETAMLVPDATGADQWFGKDVSLSGGVALIGSNNSDGSANVFIEGPAGWSDEARLLPAGSNGNFGHAVALQGTQALVSAPFVVSTAGLDSGEVFHYSIDPDPPTSYCTAGSSEIGCQALMSAAGTPSATAASGFDLVVSQAQGSKRGLFFFGANGKQANPWGTSSSLQCVTPPVVRTPLLQERGTEGQCDGNYTYDLNARWTAKPQHNPGFGAVVQAQFWYRDPFAANNVNTALSDAIEFTVGP